jgi:hypothetical protein
VQHVRHAHVLHVHVGRPARLLHLALFLRWNTARDAHFQRFRCVSLLQLAPATIGAYCYLDPLLFEVTGPKRSYGGKMQERTWEISDIDGGNKRRVTLAQYRAELDARKALVQPIADAFWRGDLAGVERAQAAIRGGLKCPKASV